MTTSSAPHPPAPPAARRGVRAEWLLLALAVFWALAANRTFLLQATHATGLGQALAQPFGLGLVVLLVALNLLLLLTFAVGRATRIVASLLIVAAAAASYYAQAFGVYVDPSMVRNVVRTDVAEAREVLSASLALHLLWTAALPLAVVWSVPIARRPFGPRAVATRLGWWLATAAVGAAVLMAQFQPLASLMRNDKALRYHLTPANFVWSVADVATAGLKAAPRPRQPIGQDATLSAAARARTKPLVLVLVVGETVRAASWGLSGYARQTTPELARRGVVDFPNVAACGTNTEVSLPCMFAPVGRRDYDEARIRGSQSLLHVVARAGVGVDWLDNQSGCKGICEGLSQRFVKDIAPPALCAGDRCLDEGLLSDLDARLAAASGTQLWVLHMLGNHGPSYWRRYPPAFERYVPACREDDLQRCSTQQIVNAYDNAVLYTDHVLAMLIDRLAARAASVDAMVLYVSDHGESLGEKNLFLHGVPYAIAPKEQTQVPMVAWATPGLAAAAGFDWSCLAQRAQRPAAHDDLFSTVLDVLGVQTSLRSGAHSLVDGCRR